MRAEHIKYFLALAENHSITKTSLEFYTTHQSVSKAIRQLEEEMETQLFTRSQKGMTLTPQGELMLPVARETLNAFRKLRLDIKHMNRCHNLEGMLHLINTPVTNASVVQSLIDDFNSLYPKVRYNINELYSTEAVRYIALHHNSVGLLAIMHSESYNKFYEPYINQIHSHLLFQDEYMCVVGPHSPLAERKTISLQEFVQYPIARVQIEKNQGLPIAQILHETGYIEPTLLTESRHLFTQAIEFGKYVSITSRRASNQNALYSNGNLILIPFEDDLSLDIVLATNAQPDLDEVSSSFVSMVTELAKARQKSK